MSNLFESTAKPKEVSVNPHVNSPDLPAEYQGLIDANPYRNIDYRQSGWQKFLGFLGFRTDYDKYIEQMQVQANEYNAAVAEKAYNELYDSSAANVARERAAGLNPDLIGSDQGGSSSALSDDGNPPVPSESDLGQVAQFASGIMSIFTTAVGFAKDLRSLQSLRLANEAQDISNVQGLMNTALDAVLKHTPAFLDTDPTRASDSLNRASFAIGEIYRGSMSKRQYKRFMSEVNALMKSAPADSERYKIWRDRIDNRSSALSAQSSRYYDENDEVMMDLIEPLVECNDRILKAEKSGAALHAENVESYESQSNEVGLPSASATQELDDLATQKEINADTRQSVDMNRELRSTLAKIIHNLKRRADSGKRGSGLADTTLLLMSLFSLMNMSKSTSSDSKGGTKSSFSFGF